MVFPDGGLVSGAIEPDAIIKLIDKK